MASVKIITTADGSHSLLNEDLNETYHSVHGAIQESTHVFIQNGFDYFLTKWAPERVSVLEVGFGTGLNALLTIQRLREKPVTVKYTAIEAYPLTETVWSVLNYIDVLGLKDAFTTLHQLVWEKEQTILTHFSLLKRCIPLEEIVLDPASFDLIYFDAFAPNKQPELWTFPMLQKVVRAMNEHAVFVTYCAKGQLKRDLKALGLVVETLPGPPGKNEMVRATKASALISG
jgi:tRNA U34 5-methylaminomethyl-2-thiouridine-forming methyltransferase MnmC